MTLPESQLLSDSRSTRGPDASSLPGDLRPELWQREGHEVLMASIASRRFVRTACSGGLI